MRTIGRNRAIELLRTEWLARVDDEHSVCEIAAREKIFCNGFKRWTFGELKQKYDWMVARRPRITRERLEDLANRWQLVRRFVNDEPLACDNQMHGDAHPQCRGWDEFDEEELAQFIRQLTGEELRVVSIETADAE